MNNKPKLAIDLCWTSQLIRLKHLTANLALFKSAGMNWGAANGVAFNMIRVVQAWERTVVNWFVNF